MDRSDRVNYKEIAKEMCSIKDTDGWGERGRGEIKREREGKGERGREVIECEKYTEKENHPREKPTITLKKR